MTAFVGLIRGINVGKAKRIGMSQLRAIFEELGHSNVNTLLNSGNVVFVSRSRSVRGMAADIERKIQERFSFAASVIVLPGRDLRGIVSGNPLLELVKDPARHLVVFSSEPKALSDIESLLQKDWTPDALAVGRKASYLWCQTGLLDSKLAVAVTRLAGERVTTRNWSTVCKLLTRVENVQAAGA